MEGQIPKIVDNGIEFQLHNGSVMLAQWHEIKALKKSLFSSNLFLKLNGGRRISLGQPRPELEKFLSSFFDQWLKNDNSQSRKVLFDYVEPKRKAYFTLLAICLVFGLTLGIAVCIGSFQHAICSQNLRQNPVLVEAEILKLKKRMRGNFKMTLAFTAENGQRLIGKRETVKFYKAMEKPSGFSIIYAKNDPSCWVLSGTHQKIDINWADRRVKMANSFSMASLLILFGLIGSIIAIAKIIEKRAYLTILKEKANFSL